ncbi:MAG: ATP-binding protein [Dehalococcoidia bacterium]
MEQAQTWQDVDLLRQSIASLPEPVGRPFLILVSGLPGTGKSYVSGRLVERLSLAVLETDTLRKTLFPTPIYTATESARLFQACHLLIEELLRRGVPVLLDATNLLERHREHLYSIAERLEAKLLIVRVEAPPEEVMERLQRRTQNSQGDGYSDADWQVYQRMVSSVEAIKRNHFVADTSRDVTPVIDKIVREVNKWIKI